MLITHIYCSFTTVTFLLFTTMLYLYFKHREEIRFFYGSLFFLCGMVMLFSGMMLELGFFPAHAAFWSKIFYSGGTGYTYTAPLFLLALIRKDLNRGIKIVLGTAALFGMLMVVFTDIVVVSESRIFGSIISARPGILFGPFCISAVAICSISFIWFMIVAERIANRPRHYYPLLVGLGISIVSAVIEIAGELRGAPLIGGINHPVSFGILIASAAYIWTYMGQYSLTISGLSESRDKIEELSEKSKQNYFELVELIANTLDAKDHYTAGHSIRVMAYAEKIAQALTLPLEEINILKQACLMHDIGKIGIPDGILNKKSPLTPKEREHIVKHPILGKKILSTVSDFQAILDIIHHHHERVDGKGYPKGLKKEEIPLLARIIAVADTYDAMRSERPYRKAKSKQEAIDELKSVSGTQLDNEIVGYMIKIVEQYP
jgi:putative nucleotidyltransferase with HDIG domain